MNIFQHPKTTIIGIVTVLCGSAHFFNLIPPPYGQLAVAVCNVLVGIGLIAAADGKSVPPKA